MPSDECDRAQAAIEVMEAHREMHKRVPHLIANGTCHYCGVAIKDGLRWCGSECGWAWEYEEERRRVNGSTDR